MRLSLAASCIEGNQFPASYQGVYFYGDFAQNWIRYLTLDAAGNVTGNMNFLPPDGTLDGPYDPVMLKEGHRRLPLLRGFRVGLAGIGQSRLHSPD